jgi:hypothetical protein
VVLLDRIVAMMRRLGRRGNAIREGPAEYAAAGIEAEADTDFDPDPVKRGRARDC